MGMGWASGRSRLPSSARPTNFPPTQASSNKKTYPMKTALQVLLLSVLVGLQTSSTRHLSAQDSITPETYHGLRYRLIGPHRASRTVGGVGIPDQPNVFFVGVNNGGVWKTDDFGRTWNPIFDDAPTGSVGDVAVSPSHPDVIYVGTGEGLHRPDLGVGDGIFKSTDGGESWRHMGLADVQQVGRIIVHPADPDIVFVAGLGHPYGSNGERGVFRTTDGGESWERVLYLNHNTGAIQVEFDPTNPEILFADMWEHREGPWENASFSGPNSGLYKSTDGGTTWRHVTDGLPGPDQGLGRIGVGISPSNPQRMYATVDATTNGGVYRSDDGGESWDWISGDRRVWGRGGDFAEIRVHPDNPDKVYAGNIASYRSNDGGVNWTSIKGAPGGDDYHRIWINPKDGDIMLFVTDQGATVTVNGGTPGAAGTINRPPSFTTSPRTTNSPIGFTVGNRSRGPSESRVGGNGGQISFRDWIGVGADEYAYVAPDPMNPHIIFGGRVVRHDMNTGQTQNVAPETLRSGAYRIKRTMPLLFHPADPTMLLFATNVLWKTTTGGDSWETISPDLSNPRPDVPESIGDFRTPELATMDRLGVIYAVAGSPLDANTIWAGTDDGLMHVTRDGGGTWADVTPLELRAWDKVSQVDASFHDVETAYIAINAIRRDDMRPHLYRTHDGGLSWTHITHGLPEHGPVNVVRADPQQPGLLFAGTERSVYFSVDDGDSWQPLRLNLPPSSMRDLVIHDNDLVVGTHGRSIWILDNMAPLRELAGAATSVAPYLFDPQPATRVRWNMFSDTPLPPEEPAGENPPDGAIIDFYLPAPAASVSIQILDGEGEVIRSYSNMDEPTAIDTTSLPHPTYWIRPEQRLGTEAGHQRFFWDLRREPPRGSDRQFSIAAVFKKTPDGPNGPFVHPGRYAVRLTVDGATFEKPVEVRLDPRVRISNEDLGLQTRYSLAMYEVYHAAQDVVESIDRLLSDPSLPGSRRDALTALRGRGPVGDPDIVYGSAIALAPEDETFVGLQEKALFILNVLQGADVRPTTQAREGADAIERTLELLTTRWEGLRVGGG
jgi:photosystem II stability/assembly factor-like uncharacterized protein